MSNVTPLRATVAVAQSGEEKYLTPAEVAELVPGLSVRTLREWRAARRELAWVQVSEKRVVYLESDVRAWVLSKRHPTPGRS